MSDCRPDNIEHTLCRTRPFFIERTCPVCDTKMEAKDRVVIYEFHNGWFRGDDDVYMAHAECEGGLLAAIQKAEAPE